MMHIHAETKHWKEEKYDDETGSNKYEEHKKEKH